MSNGEWVYTVVIALLGPAIQLFKGSKSVYDSWSEGGESGATPLLLGWNPFVNLCAPVSVVIGEVVRAWTGKWPALLWYLCVLLFFLSKTFGGVHEHRGGSSQINKTVCCYAVLLVTVPRMFTRPLVCFLMLTAHLINIEIVGEEWKTRISKAVVLVLVVTVLAIEGDGWDWAITIMSAAGGASVKMKLN